MASFGKKKKISEYLYTKIGILFLLCVITFLSIAVYKRYTVEREMAERRLQTEQLRQELQGRKEMLEERVEYLSGDRGIEEEIRKNFNVAREGEQVIILVGDDVTAEEKPNIPPEIKPWYQFW
jgi:cell division protein FtsB